MLARDINQAAHMKRITLVAIALATLSGCGGGGGGGTPRNSGGSGSTAPITPIPPVTPVTPPVATIDASQAFTRFMRNDQTVSLSANDGTLATATLIVRSAEAYPFVTNGVSAGVTTSRVIQLQRIDGSGRLERQSLWKFNFDADMRPVGIAYGSDNGGFKECVSVASRSDLPSATNSSGTFLSGYRTTNYSENYRSGTYAHYCDPSSDYPATVEWSVERGAPSPYFCMSLPMGFSNSKVRICTPVDSAGNQSKSLWVRALNSDGSPLVDYKDTSANRPVEEFGTTINPANYWIGAAWRPLDGYVYQRYEGTRFPSRQACREQSVVDWKKTWSASNISWTCINVTSN